MTKLLTLLFVLIPFFTYSQTCCSGGVPMSGNLGLPVGSQGSWQFSLSYDLNLLKTLKDGTTVLDDDTRKRITNSTLAEVGYTFSPRLSADLFFSYVQQVREFTPVDQAATRDQTSGIGDAVLLVKYRFYKNFQFGLGVKLPLGDANLRNRSGLLLGADLQPGSGSWDLIYWLGGSQSFKGRKSMSFNTTVIYRATGANDSYLGTQAYEFGNEFQIIAGVADRVLIGNLIIDPSIGLKYRSVRPDRTDAGSTDLNDVPGTGGKWLFIRPALAYRINSQLGIQSNIELPLYADLVHTQVTPSLRWNFGINLILQPKNRSENEKTQY